MADSRSDYNSLVNNNSVKILREYLKIKSVHPDVNYDECIKFLKKQAEELGLPCAVYEVAPKKPVLVMTWAGSQPELPTVLLNSHMDVVPVFEENWKHPPFDAVMEEDGTIYGRGVQDMKSVGIQYLEAVRKLKQQGIKLKRTVHISFVPDEEIGGHGGMGIFVNTKEFQNLNIGFSLDEGMASPTDEYPVFYGERNIWFVKFHCPGKSGHGSLLHDNTPGEKVNKVIEKMLALREEFKRKLTDNPSLTVGDVTTINLTKLEGGVQQNVVPNKFAATFDIRLALDTNETEFENTLQRIATESGEGVYIEFEDKNTGVCKTALDDSNLYWLAFKRSAEELNLKLVPRVFPGGTDGRSIRMRGVPVLGFSPVAHTPVLLHEHNETLSADTFLRGIQIYEGLVRAVGNV